MTAVSHGNTIVGKLSHSTRDSYITELPFEHYIAVFKVGRYWTARNLAAQASCDLGRCHKYSTWLGYSDSHVVTIETDEGGDSEKLNPKFAANFKPEVHFDTIARMESIGKLHTLCQYVYFFDTRLGNNDRMDWADFVTVKFGTPLNEFGKGDYERLLKLLILECWMCKSTLQLLAYGAHWEYFSLKDFWSVIFPPNEKGEQSYDESLNDLDRLIAYNAKQKISGDAFSIAIEEA
jgi:hypothetical protein